ncbi:hypothetical protein LJC20_07510 [Eubacteriales bacterium OttesenSCG-928-M02]|nr:hypothetical protein [Eubacteriales bacterium OttesenSCG-928-M02]
MGRTLGDADKQKHPKSDGQYGDEDDSNGDEPPTPFALDEMDGIRLPFFCSRDILPEMERGFNKRIKRGMYDESMIMV